MAFATPNRTLTVSDINPPQEEETRAYSIQSKQKEQKKGSNILDQICNRGGQSCRNYENYGPNAHQWMDITTWQIAKYTLQGKADKQIHYKHKGEVEIQLNHLHKYLPTKPLKFKSYHFHCQERGSSLSVFSHNHNLTHYILAYLAFMVLPANSRRLSPPNRPPCRLNSIFSKSEQISFIIFCFAGSSILAPIFDRSISIRNKICNSCLNCIKEYLIYNMKY